MSCPPKPRKLAIVSSDLVRPSPRHPCLRPSQPSRSPARNRPLACKRKTIVQRRILPPRGQDKSLALRRRHSLRELPDQVLVCVLKRSPGFRKAVRRHASLRGFKNPQCEILLMKERDLKRERLRRTSYRHQRLRREAGPPASVLACSMAMLFASPTLKLGGWSMALGARFLQTKFCRMPL